MSSCYLDTSFLVKLYVSEPQSADAARMVQGRQLVISWLSPIEIASAIHRKVKDRVITAVGAAGAIADFRRNQADGFFRVLPVDHGVFLLAEQLLDQHADAIRLRSLDTLHVATALSGGIETFGTFDSGQKELVIRTGLRQLT